jgi:hypothetical protein
MPTPIIDDLPLKAVQEIRQWTTRDFAAQRILGLDGTLHQDLGRRSHRVWLWGYLLPATAADDLKTLQGKAAAGTEVTFSADIVTALSVEKMVIEAFECEQRVGPAGQLAYALALSEAPPLPPPAEISPFGGLDGLGDLGFDPDALGDVLSDIQNQAGAIMDAADSALAAVEQLSALANLPDLGNISNPMGPISDKIGELGALKRPTEQLASAVAEIRP